MSTRMFFLIWGNTGLIWLLISHIFFGGQNWGGGFLLGLILLLLGDKLTKPVGRR